MMDRMAALAGGSKAWLRVGVLLLLVGVGAALLFTRQPRAPRHSDPLEARLELAAGAVQVDQGQGPAPAISGTALPRLAKVLVGKGARAMVRLSDGSGVFLREDTVLALAADGISLERGEVWMDTPPSEHKPAVHRAGEVTVSAADAGLSLRNAGDSVTVYVARGLAVVAAAGGRVEVHAGEQATARGTAAPDVKPVTWWADWTGGMADHRALNGMSGAGAGTIYGVDMAAAPGTPARTLEVSRQAVRAVIRDGVAETEVDQTFFNPHARPLEGWYWFTVPDGASVTGFALETNGNLVEGELIERQEAAAQYTGAVATGFQPALLEWMDHHTFRARIFPVPASGSRRVVLRYMQLIPFIDGIQRYVYPLQGAEPVRLGEFSLTVDLGEAGTQMDVSTQADARLEQGGRLVTLRRSGFKPRADFLLEARRRQPVAPVRVARFSVGGESADYVMARYVPDLDWDHVPAPRGEVVLVVDTSAAGDDAARQLKVAAAEAVLRAFSAQDRFALVALDVSPTVLYPKSGLADANESEITAALERLADHAAGGATDLASLFDVALGLLHGTEQPAVVYVGDGVATSGEMSGEQLAERLARALSTSRARFFTLGVGGEANLALLGELARAGGGQLFALDSADQTTERALRLTAAVKTPTVTDLEMDLGAGLDEVFSSANGKLTRGEEVVLLARTHHDIPSSIKVRGRLAGKPLERSYPVEFQRSLAASLVPRFWAAESIHRLLGTVGDPEAVRGKIVAMGIDYGLMTPFTSFIALDSEWAYQQRGIPRRTSPLRGVRLSALTPETEVNVLAEMGILAVSATGMACGMERSAPMEEAVRAPPAKSMPASAPPAPPAVTEKAMGRVAKEQMRAAPAAQAVADSAEPLSGLEEAKRDTGALARRREMNEDKPVPPRQGNRPAGSKVAGLQTCSDLARRPLADRAVAWERKLRGASNAGGLIQAYLDALTGCEMTDWRAESRFLQLMQRAVADDATATAVLTFLAPMPESQKYVARLILRRAVDGLLVMAVERTLLGAGPDWARIDQELNGIADPEKRLARLREYLARAPEDPDGQVRLCQLLSLANHADEARVLAGRLKERGLLTPLLVRQLGDVLARQDLPQEALRTYSEIVEFDPRNPTSRRLLGDIFLAHGWYAPAYRQYRTLTEVDGRDWGAWLRLAQAAAGSGRLDEALRLERHVAEAEGNPGPNDPRRWARLWSAARLARLIQSPPTDQGDVKTVAEGLKRRLKELQLFQGPATLVLLTWEDLTVDLGLALKAKPGEGPAGDAVEAASVGLNAVMLPATDGALPLVAKVRSGAPVRPLKVTRQDITWDGKSFSVHTKDAVLAPLAASVEL